jgi:hypothetical protein
VPFIPEPEPPVPVLGLFELSGLLPWHPMNVIPPTANEAAVTSLTSFTITSG